MQIILLAIAATLATISPAAPDCNVWHAGVCEVDPYTDPGAEAACEARAQAVEACPVFDAANVCQAYQDAFDACMIEAAAAPGTIR